MLKKQNFKKLINTQELSYVTNKKRRIRRLKRKIIKNEEFRKEFNEKMDKLELEQLNKENLNKTISTTETRPSNEKFFFFFFYWLKFKDETVDCVVVVTHFFFIYNIN